MAQNDISFQSTDQLPTDTNPLTPRVIARGSVVLTFDTSRAVGVAGFAYADLSQISPNYSPYIDVVLNLGNALITNYVRLPYTTTDTNNAIEFNAYISVTEGTVDGENILRLRIDASSRSLALNTERTFFYTVYSTQSGPADYNGAWPPV